MERLAERHREIQEFYHGFYDHPSWCERCLTIANERGDVVPFVPSPAQLRLFEAIKKQRERRRPIRIVYLKARRVRVSAAAATHLFHEIPFFSNQHAFIVSHLKRSAREIYAYVEHFTDHYKPYGNMIGLPEATGRNQNTGITWENGSYIEIATAKNVDTGRSFSLRHLQLDEFAFWPNASKLMTALLPAVPKDPDTSVLVISTANGVGGPFYELWQRATDTSQPSEWIPLFFGWWEHPDYRLPVPGRAYEFERSLSRNHPVYGDELAERAKYNLDLEQLAWRRWMILNECEANLEKFKQEYPAEPNEAFISSGRPRFDHISLGRMPVIQDGVTGDLSVERVGTRERVYFKAREDGKGVLTVYRRPEVHGVYVIGADPAQGKDVKSGEPGNSDPDYSAAQVLDARTGEQVAVYHARVQPAEFGGELYTLGWYFNWAYLVPEANGAGLGTIEKLIELEYPLSQLHRRRADADVQGKALLQYYGFETTSITRPQLVSALDDALREGSILVRHPKTLQECRTFVIGPDGKAQHAPECHDDLVLGLALAVIGLRFAPRGDRRLMASAPRGGPDREAWGAPQRLRQPGALRYGGRRFRAEDD